MHIPIRLEQLCWYLNLQTGRHLASRKGELVESEEEEGRAPSPLKSARPLTMSADPNAAVTAAHTKESALLMVYRCTTSPRVNSSINQSINQSDPIFNSEKAAAAPAPPAQRAPTREKERRGRVKLKLKL